MNSSIPRGVWKWFFIAFAITMIVLAAIVLKDKAPAPKKQSAQIQEKLSTAAKPKPQEKWVFGVYADSETIKKAARKRVIQISHNEAETLSPPFMEDNFLIFSYYTEEKTKRGKGVRYLNKAKLKKGSDGYFNGMIDKPDGVVKMEVSLAANENGDYFGHLKKFDANNPNTIQLPIDAYLKKIK
ncbi:MAG: hypothetical protein COV02_01730 [Candidatus Terrybacteria bacterium CG10_big_fil_rev_8_21_14_0_10_41_10]|uniref:Uncharacterized protein n=1 Tax=Candidatus Terrybacteria bacterium CG10_big_fil_rev_8_21_14_0_10_41_10 TaxID=1975026 RepID=A0A2M8LAH4_9BACT|nr:MAG: hypothetical protein COV02_01730 [Candidatus Terrybacteria bacterium CG10_big_fil_rev_8_21_14_0_10_41_10]